MLVSFPLLDEYTNDRSGDRLCNQIFFLVALICGNDSNVQSACTIFT